MHRPCVPPSPSRTASSLPPGAIARLKDAGIKVYMQTGDSRRTAQAVAKAVGIEDFPQ
jgi:phosphoglycolate phosphatase-like HAD superfamily hydrolase